MKWRVSELRNKLSRGLPQVGEYVARVLNGEQPENLPAPDQAADGCHRSVNSLPIEAISSPLAPYLKTAKTLGITVPPSLVTRADELIE